MIREIYIRENNTNYMTIESEERPGDENYQIKMLLKNSVPGFLPLLLKSINNRQIYNYDISSKQPVSRMYEGKNIKKDDVVNIARNISYVVKAVNEYMLDLDCVLLDARFMYMDICEKTIYFTYYPYTEKNFAHSVRELFEFVIEHLDHNDRKAVSFAYGIYQKILQEDYNPEDLIGGLEDEIKNTQLHDRTEKSIGSDNRNRYAEAGERMITEVTEEIIEEETEAENVILARIFTGIRIFLILVIAFTAYNTFFTEYRIMKIKLITGLVVILSGCIAYRLSEFFYERYRGSFLRFVTKTESMQYRFREPEQVEKKNENSNIYKVEMVEKAEKSGEIYSESYAPTQLLSDYIKSVEMAIRCKLVAQEDFLEEKEICIDENPFIIGSLANNCNFSISNKLVSRMHLRISREKGSREYFVEDLNSTNGTFINGVRVEPNQKVLISDGDMLKIAVMQFRFWTE